MEKIKFEAVFAVKRLLGNSWYYQRSFVFAKTFKAAKRVFKEHVRHLNRCQKDVLHMVLLEINKKPEMSLEQWIRNLKKKEPTNLIKKEDEDEDYITEQAN